MIIYTTADKKSPVLDYDYEIFYFEELRSNTSKLYQSALLTFFEFFFITLLQILLKIPQQQGK